MLDVGRRQFIMLFGGAAASWPFAARAQQGDRMRRIGMLMNQAADDPETHERGTAFRQGLQQLGWIEGRNVRLDIRYGAANPDNARKRGGGTRRARARGHSGFRGRELDTVAAADAHHSDCVRNHA
jgi:hypothetical protein